MRKQMIMAALAGSASLAAAQNFELTMVPGDFLVPPGGSFTITVYAGADVGTHILGGAFSLESTGECIQSISWTPAAWSQFNTDGGYAGDGDYNEVIFGQLVLPPVFLPGAGSELGGAVGFFTVQMDPGIGDFSIDFQLVGASPFSLETVDINTGQTYQSSDGTLSLGSVSVSIIPSPGALSVLGLGGLVATRRRR